MERELAERRAAAQAAGKDDTTLDFSDLPNHDIRWFNIVNDLIFVLERAKDLPVPIRGAEEKTGHKKRAAEGGNVSETFRKKSKSS